MKSMNNYARTVGPLVLLSAASLLCLGALGCANASGSPETDGPKGTETPYLGIVSGPDGEIAQIGYQNAPNSDETKPPSGLDNDCNDVGSCLEACHCAGQRPESCQVICNGVGDGDAGDGDGDIDGGDGDINDVCTGLTDPCAKCACDNIDDVSVCLDICSP